MPLLGDAGHAEMESCLRGIAASIPRPASLLIISAHWEERVATITSGSNPALLYDYYNFPAEAYQIGYPCAGNPALAGEILQMLELVQIEARLDDSRGLDHGVFVPLKIMYPNADIPCVELSLVGSLDPSSHIELGRALQPLSQRNVLVVGSGFSFHNFRDPSVGTEESQKLNRSFEQWLMRVCCGSDISEEERVHHLVHWDEAPGARHCHPREEHLLPLHVCYGVAEAPCTERFELSIMDKAASMYLW
jgi:aromatic ring-opening dioxygenase catalytic subunit (LigB family)